MLSQKADGCGRLIYAHYKGQTSAEIIQRDDGWFDVSAGAPAYFAPFEKWPSVQRRAIRQVRGRVLDVGCGAGRVALHLQGRGHDVVAIDISPLAVKTCLLRGVRDARVCPITRVSRRLGEFDTIVMLGNNFGLFGNPRRARWLLKRFHTLTSPTAPITGQVMQAVQKGADPEGLRTSRIRWDRLNRPKDPRSAGWRIRRMT